MYGPGRGIGPALRKARLHRGKTLEEASRDTKIRAEYLAALEREAFGSLRGDVYVRGFLRSYSSYLGLNPDKVVSVYNRATGANGSASPQVPITETRRPPAIRALQRRGHWPIAVGGAIVLLVVFGVAGLLSRHGSTPLPGSLPSRGPIANSIVTIEMVAAKPVQAVVVVDGHNAFSGMLPRGIQKFFQGQTVLRVVLARGGLVDMTVNGHELGAPGTAEARYSASFQPQDYRGSPSPIAG